MHHSVRVMKCEWRGTQAICRYGLATPVVGGVQEGHTDTMPGPRGPVWQLGRETRPVTRTQVAAGIARGLPYIRDIFAHSWYRRAQTAGAVT